MERREELFVIFFIFLVCVFFSGCAENQLIRKKEVLVDRRSSPLGSVLDVRVVSQDGQGFSLVSQIKNIAFVGDSVRIEELYMRGSEEGKYIMVLLGVVVGFGGCVGG